MRGDAASELRAILAGQVEVCGERAPWIGVSGGRDSMVLLDLVVAVRRAAGRTAPRVVHVDHGLDAASQKWAQQVRREALQRGCECHIERVTVAASGEGPEAAARKARYAVFERVLDQDEVLLLAHHADDQVETVLLRLLRGAGPRGLSGMPRCRPLGHGWLFRPLLDVAGDDVQQAAAQRGVAWVEDPSNASSVPDRNYLRREVLPRLAARWPEYRSQVTRSASALERSESLLATFLDAPDAGSPLPIRQLETGDEARSRALVRDWIRRAGLPSPPEARVAEVVRQAQAREDAAPCVELADVSVRRFREFLYLVSAASESLEAEAPGEVSGAGRRCLPGGTLQVVSGRGLEQRLRPGTYSITHRDGGERLRLAGRKGHRTLKKLFQEAGVPPWQRAQWPLLAAGDEIVAVPELGVCEGHLAAPEEEGWKLSWEPRDRVVHRSVDGA